MRRVTDNVMDFYLQHGDLRRAEWEALQVAAWTRATIEALVSGVTTLFRGFGDVITAPKAP